jgi:hypothetical protein
MTHQRPAHDERRRHLRFPLGLPVEIHVDGESEPVVVELVDIAEQGVRFRSVAGGLRLDQRAAFGFVIPGQQACVANGRVVRIEAGGVFVLSLDRSNAAFRGFVGSLAV